MFKYLACKLASSFLSTFLGLLKVLIDVLQITVIKLILKYFMIRVVMVTTPSPSVTDNSGIKHISYVPPARPPNRLSPPTQCAGSS